MAGPAAASVVALAACSPCDGVVGCRQPARLSVGGQIVDRDAGGAPVAGVRVTVARAGAAATAGARATAVTDGQGWWQVALPAPEAADEAAGEAVAVDVTVTPPAPLAEYRVTGVALRGSTRRGDGQVLGRWVTRPHITYIGELRDRATGAPIAGATVTFVRRGGVEVSATPRTQLTQTTTGIGYFTIDLTPAAYGPVIADLVIERPGFAPVTIADVSILPSYEWNPPLATAASSFTLGLAFEYLVTVVDRGTGVTGPGWLTFQRTGGIMVTPARVAMPSEVGNVHRFLLQPAAAGELVGDAFFEPAGTRDTVWFRGLRFTTYEAGRGRSVELRYGEGLLYSGRAVDAATGAPLANGTLRFRRTGGIALVRDTLSLPTDAAGRFLFRPPTRERGEVTGELSAPSGASAVVRLATFAADTARPIGDVRLGAAPRPAAAPPDS
jgi:hypothetical protein